MRRPPAWLVAAGAALVIATVILLAGRGTDARTDAPWRLWGRVSQEGALAAGMAEYPSGLYVAAGGDPLGGDVGYHHTRAPRLPAWRCAGFVLVDIGRRDRTFVDRVLGRNPGRLASYAPSGVVRDGRPLRWREYVRTFEEDERFDPVVDPAVVGAWDVVRGTSAAVRVELAEDGAATGLGDGARWASRDGVIVLRVPDPRARTGVRYDTIAEQSGVWTGWGDDGAEIRMRRTAR